MIVNGSVVVLGAAWFFTRLPALRQVVRPIYREMGIGPVAEVWPDGIRNPVLIGLIMRKLSRASSCGQCPVSKVHLDELPHVPGSHL